MPKMKTRRSAAKRFRVTASGKIKRKQAKLRHNMTVKTTKQKRGIRHGTYVAKSDQKNVSKMFPYGRP